MKSYSNKFSDKTSSTRKNDNRIGGASLTTPTAQLFGIDKPFNQQQSDNLSSINSLVSSPSFAPLNVNNAASKPIQKVASKGNTLSSPVAQLWSFSDYFKKEDKKFKDHRNEKDQNDVANSNEGEGFIKGAVGGALGTVGGILGGIGGGLWGFGKGLFGFGDKDSNGNKMGSIEQMKASAYNAGSMGRDGGRLVGAGIVDGTKAVAGGAVGAATGVLGAIGGGLYGMGKAATNSLGLTNKSKGEDDALSTILGHGSKGAQGGFSLGKGVVDAGVGLVEETPEMAMNLSRGAVGAATGIVGGLGGAIYGAGKAATNSLGLTTKAEGEEDLLSSISNNSMAGAGRGWDLGANSNATKLALGSAATMAATIGGGIAAGPGGSLAAGYAASRANARYWGQSNTEADITGLSSLAATGTGSMITPGALGMNPDAMSLANQAGYYGTKTANSAGGVGLGLISNHVEQNFLEKQKGDGVGLRSKIGNFITGLGDKVEKPFTAEEKSKNQIARIGKLFGMSGDEKKGSTYNEVEMTEFENPLLNQENIF
jgi:hypothetical protein